MAIQLNYTAKFLVNFPQAYLRVLKVDIDADHARGAVEFAIYPSAEVRAQDGEAWIENRIVPVVNRDDSCTPFTDYFGVTAQSAAGMNIIAGAYLYLKTLAEFAGAEDC